MAPSSAASQPPFDRSDTGQRGKQSQQGQAEEAPAEEASAEKAPELYGPLGVERHAKDDGRALILYARREREDA